MHTQPMFAPVYERDDEPDKMWPIGNISMMGAAYITAIEGDDPEAFIEFHFKKGNRVFQFEMTAAEAETLRKGLTDQIVKAQIEALELADVVEEAIDDDDGGTA